MTIGADVLEKVCLPRLRIGRRLQVDSSSPLRFLEPALARYPLTCSYVRLAFSFCAVSEEAQSIMPMLAKTTRRVSVDKIEKWGHGRPPNKRLIVPPKPANSRESPQRKRSRWLLSFKPKPLEKRMVQFEGRFQADDVAAMLRCVVQAGALRVAQASVHLDSGNEILATEITPVRPRLQGQRMAGADRVRELPGLPLGKRFLVTIGLTATFQPLKVLESKSFISNSWSCSFRNAPLDSS